jgi:esterase
VPSCTVNGVRLAYEERGSGDPILCIHGAGSSTQLWANAVEELAQLGRVIAYDRRGCSRSERPEPYERTSVSEHADDAAALLDALDAAPAVIIGRSYGGTVAIDMAIRHPGQVRALASLEGDAPRELAPATFAWIDAAEGRVREVAEQAGVDAAGEALIVEIFGDGVWPQLPEPMRQVLTENGPAILAELGGASGGSTPTRPRWPVSSSRCCLSRLPTRGRSCASPPRRSRGRCRTRASSS